MLPTTQDLFSLEKIAIAFPSGLLDVFNSFMNRLDDIQDFYLGGVQRTLMDVFKNRSIPLTIGILGSPTFFGNDATVSIYYVVFDPQLLTKLRASIRDPTWEVDIAANGYLFEDFSQLNYSGQV